MEQLPETSPDPSAETPASAPPVAEAFPPFVARPPMQEIWRRARADYLAGDSAPVVAERYGLTERNVRRRASLESWRRCDTASSETLDAPLGAPEINLDRPPGWSGSPVLNRQGFIADHPEYDEIAAARDAAAWSLLFSPSPDDMRVFAFRRAAEGAAMRRPAEATAWLRVLRLMDQCEPPTLNAADLFTEDDHLRAAMIRAMGVRSGEIDDDEEDGPEPAAARD